MAVTEVVAEGQVPAVAEAEDVELPEGAPLSPLGLLKGKREQLLEGLHLDLAVPRWEDKVGSTMWVRYGPADLTLWSEAQRRREEAHLSAKRKGRQGDPKWALKANADLLVDACRAVFFLEIGEKPPAELPPDLPTFATPELANDLDIQPGNAVRTCLAVYLTDGDLLMAANSLLGFSGEASKETSEDFLSS